MSKLHHFYLEQLKGIYWVEKKLLKSSLKLVEAASGEPLKNVFRHHHHETKMHVSWVEQIFSMLGEEPEALKCPAMAGILEEVDVIIQETNKGTAQRDVGLIFTSQKAKHYEIATYGGLVALSSTLGYLDIIPLLQQIIEQEKKTDQVLSQIAMGDTNKKALGENED